MNIYTLQYKLHGNLWQVKVIASTLKEAKSSAGLAWFPKTGLKMVKIDKTFHNTFGAERVNNK